MDYEVSFSYTLDFIGWDCPNCGANVEKTELNLWDLDCPNCGFERDNSYDPNDTHDETERYCIEEGEE